MSEQTTGGKNGSTSVLDIVSKRDGLLWLFVYVSLGLGGGSSFLVATDRVSPKTDEQFEATIRSFQSHSIDLANLRSDLNALREAHYELRRNVPPPEVRSAIQDFEARLRVLERLEQRSSKR